MLTTKRLTLRPFKIEDAEDLFNLNSDPEVLRFTGDAPFRNTEEAEQFITDYLPLQQKGFGRFAMIDSSDDQFIGWCGLKDHGNFVDLGFRLKKKYWGNGFATEASRAMLKHGFHTLELEEIVGRSAPENHASIAILEKLGMTFRTQDSCHGIPDARIYSITKWEYLKDSIG